MDRHWQADNLEKVTLPLPSSEADRLQCLAIYNILDTQAEPLYDGLVRLAAYVADTPIALMSFVAHDRQWFKARVGFDVCETGKDISFCAHVVLAQAPLIVEDARLDARFAQSPFVLEHPNAVFYAGFPIISPSGMALGTICVIDTKPKQLSQAQIDRLGDLSQHAVGLLESRSANARLVDEMNARRIAEVAEAAERMRFTAFMDQSPAVAFMKDHEGRYVYINATFEKTFGVHKESVIGAFDLDLFPAEVAVQNRGNDVLACKQGEVLETFESLPTPDGVTREWRAFKFPFNNSEGEQYVGGVAVDVTSQREFERQVEQHVLELSETTKELELKHRDLQIANEKLEKLAITDGLTGLLNHRAMQERLEDELQLCQRSGAPLSFILLDIDHFKNLNDEFGHPAGDAVLQQIAKAIQRSLRRSDVAVRYGGEEFAIILPRAGVEEAYRVAERVRLQIQNQPWEWRPITASVGVATLHDRTSSRADLIKEADDALYTSKASGRNMVTQAAWKPLNQIAA